MTVVRQNILSTVMLTNYKHSNGYVSLHLATPEICQARNLSSYIHFFTKFIFQVTVNNRNDCRTSKHSEYNYAKKLSDFPIEISVFSWQHQKYAKPEIYVVTLAKTISNANFLQLFCTTSASCFNN